LFIFRAFAAIHNQEKFFAVLPDHFKHRLAKKLSKLLHKVFIVEMFMRLIFKDLFPEIRQLMKNRIGNGVLMPMRCSVRRGRHSAFPEPSPKKPSSL
jgi:hypothetical protein